MYQSVAYRKLLNPAILLLAMTEPRVALLVRVPASLKSRLAEMAKQERRSLSKQVELLLERCLEHERRKSLAMPAKGSRRGES
jgi:hypothetical protein